MKTTEVVSVFLTMSLALLSPPVLVSPVARNGYQEDSVHTFPCAEARMTVPESPQIILLPFFKMACNIWRSLAFGASPKLHHPSKVTQSSPTVTSGGSLNTLRQIPLGPMDLDGTRFLRTALH